MSTEIGTRAVLCKCKQHRPIEQGKSKCRPCLDNNKTNKKRKYHEAKDTTASREKHIAAHNNVAQPIGHSSSVELQEIQGLGIDEHPIIYADDINRLFCTVQDFLASSTAFVVKNVQARSPDEAKSQDFSISLHFKAIELLAQFCQECSQVHSTIYARYSPQLPNQLGETSPSQDTSQVTKSRVPLEACDVQIMDPLDALIKGFQSLFLLLLSGLVPCHLYMCAPHAAHVRSYDATQAMMRIGDYLKAFKATTLKDECRSTALSLVVRFQDRCITARKEIYSQFQALDPVVHSPGTGNSAQHAGRRLQEQITSVTSSYGNMPRTGPVCLPLDADDEFESSDSDSESEDIPDTQYPPPEKYPPFMMMR